MWLKEVREWTDPLKLASQIPADEENWILLYSGLDLDYTGQKSILALKKDKEIIADDFSEFEKMLSNNKPEYENAWFGYLGYGLKNSLENLPEDKKTDINLPNLWMAQYQIIIEFDHKAKKLTIFAKTEEDIENLFQQENAPSADSPIEVGNISSNMTTPEYLEFVGVIKDAIERGDLYQANLTRKFRGSFNKPIQPFEIFSKLSKISPAPYSSFLKFGDSYIISSSPERFLQITGCGIANSQPIKGSAPRFDNQEEDQKSRSYLEQSEKDHAENLMIVDLMRNDLSRNCIAGSVKVDSLYDINSYSTVHHMSSSITGEKAKENSSLNLVKGCFPPGSMTGTPKIKAMELCSELEKEARGVYSGTIGWFGGDGSTDLSVVIRTLIIQDNKFEFQVGGAIVSDSSPDNELEETMVKAKAICQTLDIDISTLKSL